MNLTDVELLEVNFFQVVFLAEMLTEKERKEELQLYKAAALQAWLQGAAPDIKVFESYLTKLGLSDRNNKNIQKEEELKKALSVIERVKKLKKKK